MGIRSSVWNMLSLRSTFRHPMEMSSLWLDTWIWSLGERVGLGIEVWVISYTWSTSKRCWGMAREIGGRPGEYDILEAKWRKCFKKGIDLSMKELSMKVPDPREKVCTNGNSKNEGPRKNLSLSLSTIILGSALTTQMFWGFEFLSETKQCCFGIGFVSAFHS